MCTANLELPEARSVLPPIRILTMAVGAALKEKTASGSGQVFAGGRLVSSLRLARDVTPIESSGSKCCYQDEYRRADGCHCTLDFKGNLHGAPPPLRSNSPPKYPAAATNPEANNINVR